MSEGAIFASSSWPSADTDAVASTTSATTPATGTASTPTTATTTLAALVDAARTLIHSTSTTAATTTTISTTTTTTHKPTVSAGAATKINVTDLSSSLQHFGIVDYFVFILMLVVCAVIGFYFGFIEKKQKKQQNKKQNGKSDDMANVEQRRGSEALDYLVGGRKMKVIPVSLSLVASFVSGISLLGTSTEIYVYGTQYAFILITLAISGLISWYIFLPVFCNLQLTSTYEYFELRFNKSIRLMGSILFTFAAIVWLPIVIYVPALAFNQVTGVNVHIVTPIVCVVCIFYTTVGGLKAVIWTDVIQTVIMVGAIILVIIKGTINVGGLGVVWERNMKGGRLEYPTMTFDPHERFSLFAVLIGGTFYNTQVIAGNQVIVQRYLSLPGMKQVKWAAINFVVGVGLLTAMCMYNGLLLYATYYDCDPLSTGLAKAQDQLVPMFVMDLLRTMPGVPGMFVAGVFSAALSSLSTGLNSLAAVLLEDYIKPFRKYELTEHQTAIIMRLTVVIVGIMSVGFVFVVERIGTHVMQLSMTFSSITTGPLLGLFLMGLLCPSINSKSALTGSLTAFCVMTWICLNAQRALSTGELAYVKKPVTTVGCTYGFDLPDFTPTNATIITATERSLAQQIFHVTFTLYAMIGALLTISVGYTSRIFFGKNDVSKMNPELFAPCVRAWYKCDPDRDAIDFVDYVCVPKDEQKVF